AARAARSRASSLSGGSAAGAGGRGGGAGGHAVALADRAGRAVAVVLARLVVEGRVEQRAGRREHAPRALAAGHDPGVAHPPVVGGGLAATHGLALLGRGGAVADDAAGADA